MKPKGTTERAPGPIFRPVRFQRETVPLRDRQAARPGYHVYRGQNGFEAAIATHVVERLALWCKNEAPLEAYGLLVGRAFQDERGDHVVVLGVVPDPEVKAQRFFVETTPTSEFRTRMSATLLYPDCTILGWVHTHPKIGAAYSGVDRANQATWKAPHALGIVVDPWDPTLLAVYRGPESELLEPDAADDDPRAGRGLARLARAADEPSSQSAAAPIVNAPSDSAAQATAPGPPRSTPEGVAPKYTMAGVHPGPYLSCALPVGACLTLVLSALLASFGLWRVGVLERRLAQIESEAATKCDARQSVPPAFSPMAVDATEIPPNPPLVCEAPKEGASR